MSEKVVIADTSCLIILNKIDELNLLQKIFQKVFITKIIANEFGQKLPEWIIIEEFNQEDFDEISLYLDDGEASGIALYKKSNSKNLIILDDLKARKYAQDNNINFIGTLGVILEAYKNKKIDSFEKIIEKIQKTNFRISDKILEKIRKNFF